MIFKGAVANARERSEIILASGIKLRRNYIVMRPAGFFPEIGSPPQLNLKTAVSL